MANIRKYKGKWCVQVRRKGFPHVSKSFHDVKDANKFARTIESEITNGELHNYLTKNVPKKALQLHSRNQNPTFTGSPDQVFLKY